MMLVGSRKEKRRIVSFFGLAIEQKEGRQGNSKANYVTDGFVADCAIFWSSCRWMERSFVMFSLQDPFIWVSSSRELSSGMDMNITRLLVRKLSDWPRTH
jgi:hypothetical protein